MATVRLSDIVEPAVFADYQSVNSTEKTALYQSGIVVQNEMLNQKANTGGSTIEVPFWNDLEQTEANVSSDDPAVLAVSGKLTSGKQIAHIANLNRSLSASDLASEISGSDPLERIVDRIEKYWARQFQKRLISSCIGIVADNVANYAGDMVFDVATEDGVNSVAANNFSRNSLVDAIATLGDADDSIVGLGLHSTVYHTIIRNDDIEFIVDSQGALSIPTYMGKRIVKDDGMPKVAGATSGFKYTSFLFGQGLFGYGEGTPDVPVEVERLAAGGNGGGIETIHSRKTYLLHPFGFQFTGASVASQSATLAELKLAANWDRVVDRKNVPFAALITNG